MKKIKGALCGLLLATTVFAFHQKVDAQVILYKDANFQGESKAITQTMNWVGDDWNDLISSIRIPSGYIVEVFSDSYFAGESMILKSDWDITQPNQMGWNDKISSIKVTAPVVTPLNVTNSASASADVILYKDADFKGESRTITTDVDWVGYDWNDCISSIRVPAGYSVQVYFDSYYGGQTMIMGQSWSSTMEEGNGLWNDQISSIKIIKNPTAIPANKSAVVLYKGRDFTGESRTITTDVDWLGDVWNDQISSIQIPAGYKVQIFWDSYYGGTSVILQGNANFYKTANANWEKQVSSIKIIPPAPAGGSGRG